MFVQNDVPGRVPGAGGQKGKRQNSCSGMRLWGKEDRCTAPDRHMQVLLQTGLCVWGTAERSRDWGPELIWVGREVGGRRQDLNPELQGKQELTTKNGVGKVGPDVSQHGRSMGQGPSLERTHL